MAAIAPRLRAVALVLVCAAVLRGDDSADVHSTVGAVAEALSSGDATQAMISFSKSYADYDKLSSDFDALAGAYFVESQIGFMDEEVAATAATVTVHWTMTLTTRQSAFTKNKSADITLKLVKEGKHWRITKFGPIGIFEPA